MDYLQAGRFLVAEAYYREALRLDPGHTDAWVHVGNLRFGEGRVAEARTIGDPARYPVPFWGDVDSRPSMRALRGRGLCLWRLGQVDEARRIFTWMLELSPNDDQGIRLLLHDLDEGLTSCTTSTRG
jgi:Flp pilus assembly protein TadD